MDEIKTRPAISNTGPHRIQWLPWSLMLLVLSLVEGTLSYINPSAGSLSISKISFILAISLFVMFYRSQKALKVDQRQNSLN